MFSQRWVGCCSHFEPVRPPFSADGYLWSSHTSGCFPVCLGFTFPLPLCQVLCVCSWVLSARRVWVARTHSGFCSACLQPPVNLNYEELFKLPVAVLLLELLITPPGWSVRHPLPAPYCTAASGWRRHWPSLSFASEIAPLTHIPNQVSPLWPWPWICWFQGLLPPCWTSEGIHLRWDEGSSWQKSHVPIVFLLKVQCFHA